MRSCAKQGRCDTAFSFRRVPEVHIAVGRIVYIGRRGIVERREPKPSYLANRHTTSPGTSQCRGVALERGLWSCLRTSRDGKLAVVLRRRPERIYRGDAVISEEVGMDLAKEELADVE